MKGYIAPLLTVLIICGLTTCDERYEEVNTNPNGIADVNPSHLFATAVRNSFRSGLVAYDYQIAGQMAHIYVGVFVERFIDQYLQDLSGGSYENVYQSVFQDQIRYYNEILMLTGPGGEKEHPMQYAVADIMAVFAFAKLTDAYGDVPYSEGGRGNFGELLPAYDRQRDIYFDLIDRLGQDIVALKSANGTVGMINQDPIFDDDPDLWVRFANSLRLRLAMRIRHVEPVYAGEIIQLCLNDPLIVSNDHNVVLWGVDGDNSQLFSPWFNIHGYYNFRISDRIVQELSSTNDPRLPIYAKPISDGTYRGFVNGLVETEFSKVIDLEHSFPGDYLVGKAGPLYLFDAAEVAFLKAECALFGLGETDANAHYRNGIQLAMSKVGVSNEALEEFMATETATLSGTPEEQFEQICTQLWLALPPNLVEAYAMMRRTGYPAIPTRDGVYLDKGDTDGELPSRLIYPLSEKLRNGDNVESAVENLDGGDQLKSRVWWDVRR